MSFYTDVIQKDPRYHSLSAVRDTSLLFPPFWAQVEAVLAELSAKGQDFEVIETYRSQERQHQLFLAHATQLVRVGLHGYGLACDCARVIGGRVHWEPPCYADYGPAGEVRGLTWGGRFSFGDFVHMQYIPVADQTKVFSGAWYPT